jgi:hypothetical protein
MTPRTLLPKGAASTIAGERQYPSKAAGSSVAGDRSARTPEQTAAGRRVRKLERIEISTMCPPEFL